MTSAKQALNQVVDEQIRVAEAVLDILEVENQALIEGDILSLNTAGAEKAELVVTMEQLEQQRELIVRTDTPIRDSEHKQRWDRLMELMTKCKDRNERNRELVRSRREHVAQALKVLHGETLELYDASGLAASASSVNELGKA